MRSFKMIKRRSVQKLLVSSGKTETTLYDASYETLVQEFLTLERHLTSILSKLKGSRRATERSCAVHAALTSYFSLPFADTTEQQVHIMQQHQQQHQAQGKGEDGEAPGTPASAPFSSIQGQPANLHDSLYVADCYSKMHTVVQTSAMKVLQDNAIEKLEHILREEFPLRKKKIAEDAGLRTDVESYRRRVRTLTDKGREGHDAALQKFTVKLESASSRYRQSHQELVEDLASFCANRKIMLEPIYSTFVATQLELHAFMAHQLREIVNQAQTFDSVEEARERVQDFVIAGGAPALKPKPKERMFSRIHNRLAGKHRTSGTVGHPAHQDMGSPHPSMASPNSYGTQDLPGTDQHSEADSATMTPRTDNAMPVNSPGFGGEAQNQRQMYGSGAMASPSPGFSGAESASFSSGTGANAAAADTSAAPAPSAPALSASQNEETVASPGDVQPLTAGSHDSGRSNGATATTDNEPATAASYSSGSSRNDSVKSQKSSLRSPQPVMSPDGHELYIATFNFDPVDEGDLAFAKNDIIKVLKKIDDGWWRCELDGREGVVPTTYIKRYEA